MAEGRAKRLKLLARPPAGDPYRLAILDMPCRGWAAWSWQRGKAGLVARPGS